MTRTEKENLVPVWERITISLEEAAAYSGIGVRKLRDMTDKPECNYVIWVGNRSGKSSMNTLSRPILYESSMRFA